MNSIFTTMKFHLFSMFQFYLNGSKSNDSHNCRLLIESDKNTRKYLWVFVSTIGELNAISSFLSQYIQRHPEHGLVLLTDRPHYAESYKKKYPQSIIISHGTSAYNIEFFLDEYPISSLILAEIPSIPYDAPCRFSFRVLYEIKKRSVPVFLINGWLYNEPCSCRMDSLEKKLFHKDYINCIDLFSVQTEAIKAQLIKENVDQKKIHVTGNLKFDSVLSKNTWNIENTQSSELLKKILASNRPCVVAGCVSELEEQTLLLDMYLELEKHIKKPLFVLVPRHPEKKDRMQQLEEFLRERNLNFIFRSTMTSFDIIDFDVLILDTYGELKDFYAISSVSYIGYNHNILEPLTFEKNCIVSKGWESAYPSYPIYKILREHGIIHEAPTPTSIEISSMIVDLISKNHEDDKLHIRKVLNNLTGATDKTCDIIFTYINNI